MKVQSVNGGWEKERKSDEEGEGDVAAKSGKSKREKNLFVDQVILEFREREITRMPHIS